jgi:hypothetical protein
VCPSFPSLISVFMKFHAFLFPIPAAFSKKICMGFRIRELSPDRETWRLMLRREDQFKVRKKVKSKV